MGFLMVSCPNGRLDFQESVSHFQKNFQVFLFLFLVFFGFFLKFACCFFSPHNVVYFPYYFILVKTISLIDLSRATLSF